MMRIGYRIHGGRDKRDRDRDEEPDEDAVDLAALLHDNDFSWDDANAVNAVLTHHGLLVVRATPEPDPETATERPIEDQIEVLMGYVSLWNDVRPVVEAARAFMGEPSLIGWDYAAKGDPGPALSAALRRYEALYPEHLAS